MKKHLFLIAGLLLLLNAACDSKKEVAEDVAKEFATAVNDKDLSEINTLYPLVSKMTLSHVVDSLNYKNIKIEKLDSIYTAEFEPSGQILYINVNEDKSAEILNSRGIVVLNEDVAQVAQSSGVPIKRTDDYQLDMLFQPSLYMDYLADEISKKVGSPLEIKHNDINWVAGNNIEGLRNNVKISVKLTNDLNHEIKSDQYNVEINVAYGPGYGYSKLYVEPGVNLKPNESHVFYVTDQNLYQYFHRYNVVVTASVVPKDQTNIGLLGFYGEFKGTEYNDFLKKYPQVNIEDINTYAVIKKVNEEAAQTADDHLEDIKNFIKTFYNSYVFGKKDLAEDKKFYEKHLSPSLIKKLKDEYEDETGMDDGLAIWLFTSFGGESIGTRQINNISYEGDGVFKVNVQDGPSNLVKYITAKYVDNEVVLENVADI